MLVTPRPTEKAYNEQTKNTYIFTVEENGSKQEIKQSIESQYNVTVKSIRILTRKGKKTRFSKGKHAYPGTTFRADKKIAYATLKDGDSIHVFEEVSTEAPAKDQKDDAKQASKSSQKGEK